MTKKTASDHKLPKLTRHEEEFQRKLTAYFDEKLLNVVLQVRALAIAGGISPEKFWAAFVNDTAQDDFFVKLHVEQDKYNLEQQAKINQEKAAETAKIRKE